MSTRGVLVVGTGKRARETALPAFQRLPRDFELRGLFARRAKELEVGGRRYAVRAAESLGAEALAGVDLVYVAVAKDAVPQVLARLAALPVEQVDLLIDTPVVRFKHYRHVERLKGFRAAWVAEDCVHLPWIGPVRRALASGAIGAAEGVLFSRSAYAYHGLATAKALLGERRVLRARRRDEGGGLIRRQVWFAGPAQAWMIEPRDYATGRIAVLGKTGSIADYPVDPPPGGRHLELAPVLQGGRLVGVRAGDELEPLDDDERALAAGDAPDLGLTARMEAWKRVGFLRLLRSIARGSGGYPVEDALEDMVVDYHLERLGRYRATPLTDPRAPLAQALLRLASRVAG